MAYINVRPDEFDDDELIEELEYRGYSVFDKQEMPETASIEIDDVVDFLTNIYLDKRVGKEYTKQLDDLIYKVIGRM